MRSCQPGDRVCIDPNCYCGTCAACRSGLAHFCTQMVGYGTTVDGGFAEYCAVDARQVYRLGAHTSFAQGAMAEPAACCLHGIDLCGIRPGHQVVVIGGGMIGLLMVQLARLAGAARVALVEPVAAKRETGRKLGADVCIDPQQQDTAAALRQGGLTWVNTVIECVGRPETIAQAIDLAGSKAVVMMFGLTKPDETVPLKPFTVFEKELELKASYINPYTQRARWNSSTPGGWTSPAWSARPAAWKPCPASWPAPTCAPKASISSTRPFDANKESPAPFAATGSGHAVWMRRSCGGGRGGLRPAGLIARRRAF